MVVSFTSHQIWTHPQKDIHVFSLMQSYNSIFRTRHSSGSSLRFTMPFYAYLKALSAPVQDQKPIDLTHWSLLTQLYSVGCVISSSGNGCDQSLSVPASIYSELWLIRIPMHKGTSLCRYIIERRSQTRGQTSIPMHTDRNSWCSIDPHSTSNIWWYRWDM